MRASSILVATMATIIAPAAADFYIYATEIRATLDGFDVPGYAFFKGPPDCKDARNAKQKPDREDVSGSKYGVRCDGCGIAVGSNEPVDVKVLEFNDKDYGHYTFYKDRGGDLVDLDGKVVGNCKTDNSDDYLCSTGVATFRGMSQIWCKTSLSIP